MKILVVDDDENSRVLMTKILESDGHTVDIAMNGEEGLQMAKELSYGMIVSDILMPVMDGFQLCQKVREDSSLKDILFVFCTGTHGDQEDEDLATKLLADGFIVKPIDPHEILRILQNVISNSIELPRKKLEPPPEDDKDVLKLYKQRLVQKLEKKQLELKEEIQVRKKAEDQIREYSEKLKLMVDERTEELNRALHDAERAKERVDVIIESIAAGLIVTDTSGSIILMNQPAETLLNTNFSEIAGQSIDLVFKHKFKWNEVTKILDDEKKHSFDFELESNEPNHPMIIRARSSSIYDKEDKRTGIVTIINDVTHERLVDRLKTEFISTAAHEFRTPLTSIQGFSEILLSRDNLSSTEKKKFLGYINKQALSLATIVSDLLDIARIESKTGFTLNKTPCKIGDAIGQTIKFFQNQTNKHSFEVVAPKDPYEIWVDQEKMAQVLKNIIGNAIKYSPDGGLIRVTGEAAGDFCRATIEDQGIGMTPEQIEKIFDKFYRADASDSAVEGTGLGMTIVKYIIEAHGGKVYVDSKIGKGTKVTYEIPKQQDSDINNDSQS